MFLILTKILSKSAKSLQDDWNMCMNWFTNRFSILEIHGYHHYHPQYSYTLIVLYNYAKTSYLLPYTSKRSKYLKSDAFPGDMLIKHGY